jgi:pentatricopeptide repeat domain-containing protein 1
MMNVCASSTPARWEEAILILHNSDIDKDAVGPANINAHALNYAIFACTKADQWSEAINLLELYAKSVTKVPLISVEAMNSVIASVGRNGRPDLSLRFLNDMSAIYSVEPDSRSYRSAIIACNQAEHSKRRLKQRGNVTLSLNDEYLFQWWEAALSLFRRMRESKLTPDIQTYSSVISACEAAGQWQRALGLLRSMTLLGNDGPAPNLFCFNAAIAACEKGGAWVEALDLYERLRSIQKPNFITLNSLLISLDNAGQRELASDIYCNALRTGIISPWKQRFDWDGMKIRALDLHHFSAPLAKTAVRCVLDSLLLPQPMHDRNEDLIVIVGKGNGSEGGKSILLPVIKALFMSEYEIESEAVVWNSGRLCVQSHILGAYVERKSFRRAQAK